MSESIANGITVQNTCYECMVIARDTAEHLPVGKCQTCLDDQEAREDDNAWNLHEDDRLGEGPGLSVDVSDAPSASEWVASETYVRPAGKKAVMFEEWDKDNPFKLVELKVEFIDEDEDMVRHEYLPPIAQLIDGGVYEELWELQDERQRARETECPWCHILTLKLYNDCQTCDKPLENNVR